VGKSTGYDYSRTLNPTREQVEIAVASLEGACGALAFSTGMAAIGCLLEIFKPGDEIIAGLDLYGGTVRIFDQISVKNGLKIKYADTGDIEALSFAITPATRAIFIETPSNPMMHITDISAVNEAIRDRDILIIADNTFLTPYFCRPLFLGADIVIHSGTKYLGGHNDALAGFLAVKDKSLEEELRNLSNTIGSVLSPFDSYLILRGIKTLAIRMEKSQENALEIANWLKTHKKVKKVNYAGLPDHPGYDILKKNATGFGAMISFEVDSKETAVNTLKNLSLIYYAESLGGVESLMTYPVMQTHAYVQEEVREKLGITDSLLRLSVGIEDVRDIIADLEQAIG
jgi:cystathionine beta-lyase/cystathionine gamma-synthase